MFVGRIGRPWLPPRESWRWLPLRGLCRWWLQERNDTVPLSRETTNFVPILYPSHLISAGLSRPELAYSSQIAPHATPIDQAHNPEVAGSNPAPATGKVPETGLFSFSLKATAERTARVFARVLRLTYEHGLSGQLAALGTRALASGTDMQGNADRGRDSLRGVWARRRRVHRNRGTLVLLVARLGGVPSSG